MSGLLDRVRATGLLPAGEPVLVLLSGGRDSVCLLDLAVLLGATVRALHVDFGLRPEAADDAAFCEQLCERLRVPLEVAHAVRPDGPGNLHAWARDTRYGLAARAGLPIATGHTRTDQAETVLYRLAASPGRRALLGMAPADGRLVRPLLDVTREETGAWCTARGLTWREDAGNDDPAYARARVRGRLVPALEAIHPAAVDNVVRTAALLREEAAVLDGVVGEVLGGEAAIEAGRLAALPRALARLVLRRLCEDAVGGLVPRAGGRLEDVLALAPDGMLDIGDGARADVRRGVLRVVRSPGR